MDLEMILKGVALVVAIGLLLSSIDFSYLLAKLTVKKKSVNVPNIPLPNGTEFIKTLELWYALKTSCDKNGLSAASEKMDEVFPLLNDNMEVEKDA